jgi:hypothetical protein
VDERDGAGNEVDDGLSVEQWAQRQSIDEEPGGDGAERDADGFRGVEYKSQVELDTLIDHLTAALGVGDKTRSAGGTAERARSAVTHRVRTTIGKLEKVDPGLGRHLRHAIDTGTFCSYRPEEPTTWDVT